MEEFQENCFCFWSERLFLEVPYYCCVPRAPSRICTLATSYCINGSASPGQLGGPAHEEYRESNVIQGLCERARAISDYACWNRGGLVDSWTGRLVGLLDS